LRNFGKDWSDELKLVAANSWWLSSLVPPDIVAFDEALALEIKSHGAVFGHLSLLRLWAAAYVKEPKVALEWMQSAGGELGVSASSRELATSWAQACERLASLPASDRMALPISGRKPVGLAPFLRAFGVGLGSPAKRSSSGQVTGVTETAAGTWEQLINIPMETLQLPKTGGELVEAISRLDEWLELFPAQFGHGKRGSSCVRKDLLRKFAFSFAKKLPPGAMRSVAWKDMRPANCDLKNHTAPFEGFEWGEIEDRLGLHPLLVASWACMFSNVQAADIAEHFKQPRARILDIVQKLCQVEGAHPSLSDIAKSLKAKP
jgi:hypothetical protein